MGVPSLIGALLAIVPLFAQGESLLKRPDDGRCLGRLDGSPHYTACADAVRIVASSVGVERFAIRLSTEDTCIGAFGEDVLFVGCDRAAVFALEPAKTSTFRLRIADSGKCLGEVAGAPRYTDCGWAPVFMTVSA
ncbi:RICIN domain-containing protein [Allokutzneria albata]|uniref:Uncharacterized protein n=1 Tax=Allokutzneria albata TaxID=211114 RepID=A0A1G9TPN9_ALLAB|nr:hypothetical protein [Allokutzneria albata]SDM49717.1 hypothetical protein SAMN04489726_1920 [Allokutzneria albata]